MSPAHLSEVLDFLADTLKEHGAQAGRLTDYEARFATSIRRKSALGQALWSVDRAKSLLSSGQLQEAVYRLGFIEGVLWRECILSIQDIDNMHRPRPDDVPVLKVGTIVRQAAGQNSMVSCRIVHVRPSGYTMIPTFAPNAAHEVVTDNSDDPYLSKWVEVV